MYVSSLNKVWLMEEDLLVHW